MSCIPSVTLCIVQKATWAIDLAFKNDDDTPMDLTGATLFLEARHDRLLSLFEINSNPSGAITITNAAGGLAAILVGSDQTALMSLGSWTFVFRVDSAGNDNDDVPFGGKLEVQATP